MSFLPIDEKDYSDGRTKQAFADSTDINKILKRAQKTGTISHLSKYGAQYGDLSNFDFHEAQNQLAKAREIFEALPSEVRKEFANDPRNFFEFANDPENAPKLDKILPAIAEPGSYFPDVNRTQPTPQPVAASEPETAPAIPEPQTPPEPDSPA